MAVTRMTTEIHVSMKITLPEIILCNEKPDAPECIICPGLL